MARPSEFTEEIADRICELLADGKKLAEICAREDMPAASTIYRWLAAHPEFEKHYGMARRAYAHRLEDECIEIADDVTADQPPAAEDGARTASYVGIQRAKLRIEVRRWLIRRLAPRRFGRPKVADSREEAIEEPCGPIEVEIN